LDALGDGIFGVAMTLLVLDIRLPEDFHATTSAELLKGLVDLLPKFFPYVLSFFVLGVRWQWEAEERGSGEPRLYSRAYVMLWLFLLFLVTCTPFTTIVLGRFLDIPMAIWLYVANISALSVVSFFLAGDAAEVGEERWRSRVAGVSVLLISCVVVVAVTFVSPEMAMWGLLLNVLTPFAVRLLRRS
jgi:uncharacterized membrane protein